jgi:RNA polymerase sigma factor (sigma-70 family)
MSEDRSVTDLVARARNGDKQAWDDLVERYAPLVWYICRRRQLSDADADDVAQSVWLQLVSQLDKIRDPAALPGCLATTTRRECGRVLRGTRGLPADGQELPDMPDDQTATAEHELLAAERDAALRQGFARLPPADQRLLAMLIADPPAPYAQISAKLGIPVESIGPGRRRHLDRLRRDPATAGLISAQTAGGGQDPAPCLSNDPYRPSDQGAAPPASATLRGSRKSRAARSRDRT